MPRRGRKQGENGHNRARDSRGRFLPRKPQESKPSEYSSTPKPTLNLPISPSASTSQSTTTPQQQFLTAPVTIPTTGQAAGAIAAPMSAPSMSSKSSIISPQLDYPTEMDRANGNGIGLGDPSANDVNMGNTGNPHSETKEIEREFPPSIGNRTTQHQNRITPFVDSFTITPIRVKKVRPSLSPVKTRAESKPKPRRFSEEPTKKPSTPHAEINIGTAALNFREFSFWNEDGHMLNRNISDAHRKAFHDYLMTHYGVTAITISLPFLYLECYPSAPPENERPFSIAGAISVWLEEGQEIDFCISVGERAEGERVEVAEDLKDDLHKMRNPQEETLLSLARSHFPNAIAISFVWGTVVVELPSMSNPQFGLLLQELPGGFVNANVGLEFHNGPLPYNEHRRKVQPDPTSNGSDAIADETDYVKEYGCFYPGAMIRAVEDIGSVTASILVEKGLERRLAVSYHCWEPLIQKNPDTFGSPSACTVIQGNPGTEVGFVHKRIKTTDIALAKLLPSVEFRNEFMEIDARPKRLLPSNEIEIGDEFMIDSFVTGKQRLKCAGMRLPLVRRKNARSHPDLMGPESLLPQDEIMYVKLRQGIYATNEPKILTQPKIRAGVCGAVLVRCHQFANNTRSLDSVLKDGEVAGFMHFADLRSKGLVDTLLCYADSFDELASEGWEIVQTTEKRKEPGGNDEEAL